MIGQTHRNPACNSQCSDPSPPIYVEKILPGLVLDVEHCGSETWAIHWNMFLEQPDRLLLETDDAYPDLAEPDATEDVQTLYSMWKEEQDREERLKREQFNEMLQRWDQEKRDIEIASADAARRTAELADMARKSVIKKGVTVEIVADPPGRANKGKKNLTNSLVGLRGRVTAVMGDSVFVHMASGSVRVTTARIRRVLDDGHLGVEDITFAPNVEKFLDGR